MQLEDVRDFIAALGIAEDENVYMGRMDNKKDRSIGVYHLKRAVPNKVPLGGPKNGSYGVKNTSILVHWDKSPRNTEKTAQSLFNKLQESREETVNGRTIKFITLLVDEPQDVGTDENGIYEMVIEAAFIYERKVV